MTTTTTTTTTFTEARRLIDAADGLTRSPRYRGHHLERDDWPHPTEDTNHA